MATTVEDDTTVAMGPAKAVTRSRQNARMDLHSAAYAPLLRISRRQRDKLASAGHIEDGIEMPSDFEQTEMQPSYKTSRLRCCHSAWRATQEKFVVVLKKDLAEQSHKFAPILPPQVVLDVDAPTCRCAEVIPALSLFGTMLTVYSRYRLASLKKRRHVGQYHARSDDGSLQSPPLRLPSGERDLASFR
ncbi:hypothetical protein OH77DRAFT_558266 [Trametes cingulata]|nr:hypothetical protein OH77DRAFT_558266 [Trametes cingulata]